MAHLPGSPSGARPCALVWPGASSHSGPGSWLHRRRPLRPEPVLRTTPRRRVGAWKLDKLWQTAAGGPPRGGEQGCGVHGLGN